MYRNYKSLVIASVLLMPYSIFSAEGNEEEASSSIFDEVVVTARKREEAAQSVPIPITALGAAQLAGRNITEIKDIEKLTPNMQFDAQGINSTVTNVFLRGIGQTNWSATQDPKIGIYIDGVYLSRAQGGLVDLMDIERVEVLRGPQGTLFGRNTTAGLVHIITKAPSDEIEGMVSLGIGTANHEVVRGMLNLPVSERVSARFSIMSKETDGFIINMATGDKQGNEDSQSMRASLMYTGEIYDSRFTYDRFRSNELAMLGSCRFNLNKNGALVGGFPALAFFMGTYDSMVSNCEATSKDYALDNNANQSASTATDSYTLTQNFDLSFADLTVISNHREIDNYNGTWGWNMGNGPHLTRSGNSNLLDVINNPSDHSIDSHEIRLSGDTGNLSWTVGAYIFEEDSVDSIDVPIFQGVNIPTQEQWAIPYLYGLIPTLVGTQTYGSRTQSSIVTNSNDAIYAEGTYAIDDQTDLTVGVRRSNDDREFTRVQTLVDGSFDAGNNCPGMVFDANGFATSDRCTQEVDFSETTSRVILSHAYDADRMVFASYSKGYSSGGFNQDIRMRPFEPEISDNFEVGMKSTLRDGKLRLNVTGFHNSYENQQVTVGRIVNGQPTADLINAQEATLIGLELEMLAQLSEDWTMSLTWGHLDGQYDVFTVNDNVIDPVTLAESIVVRDLSGTGFGAGDDGVSNTFDVSFIHTASLPSGADVVSQIGMSRYDSSYNTLLNVPSSLAPAYNLVDGRVTWNFADGSNSLTLWGTNLLDKDYIVGMLHQGGDLEVGGVDFSLGMIADYWGQPRRLGLEWRKNF
jgi:iron complex outermembrane receptor protein